MIKRSKVCDGVIVNEEISIDLTSGEPADIEELRKITFFQTAEDRIKALQEHARTALNSEGTRATYAADAIRAFDDALRHLQKISDPKARKSVNDVSYCLLNACQSLWRTDVKGVEPTIVTGIKVAKQRRDAGFSSGEQVREERKSVWDRWQRLANAKWAANPRLSARDVAKQIAGPGEKVETIRRRIRKPS
jgi:hypothetical protein